ncbi:phage terminase small subunit [Devosia crocina]|uniref:Phage terminase small subunit n=1 Tax=Devosia crocina TaxID=429728 RepID=A0A1I7N9E3_9HYPH|nr:terminase small subunit [Devosia crocina]SFV31285.1 phage terminase small subunit [Devosia crocina]
MAKARGKSPKATEPTGKDARQRARARSVADKYIDDDGATPAADEGDSFDNPSKSGGTKHKRLTEREARFCEEYLVDLNGAAAARRAGYSENTAREIAYENLTKPHIRLRIRQLKRDRAVRLQFDRDRVLERLSDELDADLADLFDEAGNLLPVDEWPMAFRTGLVAGIEVEELFEGRGEDREHIGRVRKIKLADRGKRLELVGKHVDVMAFKERTEVEAVGQFAQLLGALAGTTLGPTQTPPTSALPAEAAATIAAASNPDLSDDGEDDE